MGFWTTFGFLFTSWFIGYIMGRSDEKDTASDDTDKL